MVVLHIASIKNDLTLGVCAVVPQHIKAQSNLASVGFINVNNEKIEGIDCQIDYQVPFCLKNLPKPFNKPDLVVFHETYRVEYLKISKEIRKNKIPYIIIPHGELTTEAQKKKWLKKKVANIVFFNRFISGARYLQALSKKEMENIKFSLPKFIGSNGTVLPEESKKTFSSSGLKLLYIGRLEVEIKGLDIMLGAIANVKDFMREHNCSLKMFGPDVLGRGDEVRALIKQNGIEDLVTLMPPILGEDKKKELLDADVFIQTSRSEGMPLGVLEALSYGLPCIVTKGTTFMDDINQNDLGWGVETSVLAVQNAIISAVTDRETFIKKSNNAVNFIANNYSWEKVAFDTIEEYKKIIGETDAIKK